MICSVVLISYLTILDVLILLTQQYKSTIGQDPRNEYTSDRKYYKVSLGLTAIPSDIPTDALSVAIENNRISKIESNVFYQLSECTSLGLSSNQISEVKPGAFNGLIVLARLFLENNQISEFEAGTFNGLTAVILLRLSNNRLEKINANIFSDLMRCDTLHLEMESMK